MDSGLELCVFFNETVHVLLLRDGFVEEPLAFLLVLARFKLVYFTRTVGRGFDCDLVVDHLRLVDRLAVLLKQLLYRFAQLRRRGPQLVGGGDDALEQFFLSLEQRLRQVVVRVFQSGVGLQCLHLGAALVHLGLGPLGGAEVDGLADGRVFVEEVVLVAEVPIGLGTAELGHLINCELMELMMVRWGKWFIININTSTR